MDEKLPIYVKYKNTYVDLNEYDGKKTVWHGNMNVFGRDLEEENFPDLSRATVYGDVIVSGNRLTSFAKLPRYIYGSLYANFNKFKNFDDFPDCVLRECHVLGVFGLGQKRFSPEQLGDEVVMTQAQYMIWQKEYEQRLMNASQNGMSIEDKTELLKKMNNDDPSWLHLEITRLASKETEEIENLMRKNEEKKLAIAKRVAAHSVWRESGSHAFPNFNTANLKLNDGRS